MTRDDLLDVLDKVPSDDLSKTVLILRGVASITLDAVVRREDDYIVVRGREGGTNDEGRAFFVPYQDVLFVKIDRVMKVEELKRMYGEKVEVPSDIPGEKAADAKAADAKAVTATPPPAAPMDPAAIAKQNLLARIRAARSIATSG
jgi:hypothetical protein